MTCVSEQGKNGLLWTVFEGEPFCSRRVASFGNDDDAREYLLLKQGHAGTMVEVRTIENLRAELSRLRRNVGTLYEWFQGNTTLTGHQKDAANAIFDSLEKGLREDKEIVRLRAERDELASIFRANKGDMRKLDETINKLRARQAALMAVAKAAQWIVAVNNTPSRKGDYDLIKALTAAIQAGIEL